MRLHTLELENYRRFARAALEFPDGVLGLLGRNGAGKSTLVEAIGWVLFGHEAARTGKEHLRLRDAKGDCRVRLRFELGGEEYEVTRELAGKAQQHQAVLKRGGRVLVAPGPNSAREVTLAVERALRMDREAFFTSLVARQGELSALADLTASRRKEVVMRMLRIDAVDGAIALARDARRSVEAQLQAWAGQRADPRALEDRAAKLAGQRQAEAAAAEQARQALAATDASLGAVARAKEAADGARRAHDALAARLAALEAQVASAERARARAGAQLRELDAVEAELVQLGPQAEEHGRVRAALEALEGLREGHLQRQRLAGEVQQLEADLQAGARALEALREQLAGAADVGTRAERARSERLVHEQACAERRAELASVEGALRDARLALLQAEARRGEVAQLGAAATCPLCEQGLADALPKLLARLDEDLDAQRARRDALQRKRDHAAKLLAAAQQGLEAAAARAEELRRQAEHLGRLGSEADVRRRSAADLEARLRARRDALVAAGPSGFDEASYLEQKRLAARLGPVHERALVLRARLGQREALRAEAARAEADLAALHEASAAARRDLAGLAFDPAALAALEQRLASLQERARAQAVEAERRAGAAVRLAAELAAVEEERAAQRALEAKVADLRAEVALLDRLAGERDAGLLAEFRSHLMARVRPTLADRAGELFRACTEGRYEGLELGDDYDLLVVEQGQALPLARFSGGEADLASLCLRIAIGEVLAERAGEPLGFLALDEVFGSQDSQRRANILRALAHLRGHVRQVVLITHIDDVKDALEHVVYVEDLDERTSRLAAADPRPPLVVPA